MWLLVPQLGSPDLSKVPVLMSTLSLTWAHGPNPRSVRLAKPLGSVSARSRGPCPRVLQLRRVKLDQTDERPSEHDGPRAVDDKGAFAHRTPGNRAPRNAAACAHRPGAIQCTHHPR